MDDIGIKIRKKGFNPHKFDEEFHDDHGKLNKIFKRMGVKWRMKE